MSTTSDRKWFRNSYGVITDGAGWEIAKDAVHPDDCGFCASGEPMLHQYEGDGDEYDPGKPWSLWHHGEYVANYATVEDARADAHSVDCSKCLGKGWGRHAGDLLTIPRNGVTM